MLKRFPAYGRAQAERLGPEAIEAWIRGHILGRMHAGWLAPGEKLPSIRALARRLGADHRAVANAYRTLEAEGLIEVRRTAGVYVADHAPGIPQLADHAKWAAEILFQGWQRRICRDALAGLIGAGAPRSVRCGCIESNEDHMLALRAELESGFAVETVPLFIEPDAGDDAPLPDGVTGVDLLVTSIFHAPVGGRLLRDGYARTVVVTFDRAFTAEIDRCLNRGPVTTVIVDPRYAERGRRFLEPTAHRDRARFVLVDELDRAGIDLADPHLLLTRAARRRLGLPDFHLVPDPPTILSPESARHICALLVELCGGTCAEQGPAGRDQGGAPRPPNSHV